MASSTDRYAHFVGKRVRIVGAYTAYNIGLVGIYEKPEVQGCGYWVMVDLDWRRRPLPYLAASLEPVSNDFEPECTYG
jgi:hypothetical protein